MTHATKSHGVILAARTPLLGFGFLTLLLLPGILIEIFLVSGAATVVLFAALPVAAAYFGGATNSTTGIVVLMVVTGSLARFFNQEPVPSALLIAVVGFIIGMSARRGASSPIVIVGISLSFLVINPPPLGQTELTAFADVSPVIITAVLLTLGGLWARLMIALVHKWIPPIPETPPRDLYSLIPYALALAISTGVSTYLVLLYAPNGVGAWLVLTIFVVLKNDTDKTITRTKGRIIGTLAGAALAYVVIEILQALNWQESLVQLLFATMFIGAAMSYFVPGPYWKFVFLLTPGVVLMDSNTASNQVDIDIWRVIYTLAGIGLAIITAVIVHQVTQRTTHRGKVTPGQSH